jgi:hypothetical protein
MAESRHKCVLCGEAVKIFSGLTLNGDSYHDFCWDMRDRTDPKARRSTGQGTDSNTAI